MKKRAIICLGLIFILAGCNSNTSNRNNSSNNIMNEENNFNKEFSKISIDFNSVLALTRDGELYGIGSVDGLGEGIEKATKITKIAENVKDFDDGRGTFYIDNNDSLYMAGWDFRGFSLDNYEKIYDNVMDFDHDFCLSIVTKNKDLYINRGLFGNEWCGLNLENKEFYKIQSDVKNAIIGNHFNGYITTDGDLYIQKKGEAYELVLNNVVDYFGDYYLTEDNNLYKVVVDVYNANAITKEIISTEVVEIGKNYLKKKDGKFYFYLKKDTKRTYVNGGNWADSDNFYLVDSINDIKAVFYYEYSGKAELIYLNTDNKIVLYDAQKGSKLLNYSLESMEDIYNFVS